MSEQKPGYETAAARMVRKLTLLDGSRVGIVNLDNILKEVFGLKLTDSAAIKIELLNRVKACNYVPSSAESEYSVALFQEYQRQFGKSHKIDKVEIKHPGG